MSCPKNKQIKKFLWWKWVEEGEHNLKITSVGRFMDSSADFVVKRTCTLCETVKTSNFVEMEDLIREGLSAKELNSVTRTHYLYPTY